jgi:hypothetical protein
MGCWLVPSNKIETTCCDPKAASVTLMKHHREVTFPLLLGSEHYPREYKDAVMEAESRFAAFEKAKADHAVWVQTSGNATNASFVDGAADESEAEMRLAYIDSVYSKKPVDLFRHYLRKVLNGAPETFAKAYFNEESVRLKLSKPHEESKRRNSYHHLDTLMYAFVVKLFQRTVDYGRLIPIMKVNMDTVKSIVNNYLAGNLNNVRMSRIKDDSETRRAQAIKRKTASETTPQSSNKRPKAKAKATPSRVNDIHERFLKACKASKSGNR